DGGDNLAVNATSGSITFVGNVGATTPVGSGTGAAIDLLSGSTEFQGTVQVASGITASGTAPVTFPQAVTVAAGHPPSVFHATGNGRVTCRQDVTVAAGDSASVFNANVSLDGLTFESANDVTFGDASTDTLTLSGGDVEIETTGATSDLIVYATVTGSNASDL